MVPLRSLSKAKNAWRHPSISSWLSTILWIILRLLRCELISQSTPSAPPSSSEITTSLCSSFQLKLQVLGFSIFGFFLIKPVWGEKWEESETKAKRDRPKESH
jgi:hypothetical protein